MHNDELVQAVQRGLSTREIAKAFSCSQTTVTYWLKKYRLTTRKPSKHLRACLFCGKLLEGRRKRNNQYCDKHCQAEFAHKRYMELWLTGRASGNREGMRTMVSIHVRRWCLERAGYKCEECGWDRVNPFTGKTPLAAHHIDGNAKHTRPENLKVLCPGCHSLTENYGSLNKGHGRDGRYKRVWRNGSAESSQD